MAVLSNFYGVVCVVTLPFSHVCWYRGFCHRTESDLFLFTLVDLSHPRLMFLKLELKLALDSFITDLQSSYNDSDFSFTDAEGVIITHQNSYVDQLSQLSAYQETNDTTTQGCITELFRLFKKGVCIAEVWFHNSTHGLCVVYKCPAHLIPAEFQLVHTFTINVVTITITVNDGK